MRQAAVPDACSSGTATRRRAQERKNLKKIDKKKI